MGLPDLAVGEARISTERTSMERRSGGGSRARQSRAFRGTALEELVVGAGKFWGVGTVGTMAGFTKVGGW